MNISFIKNYRSNIDLKIYNCKNTVTKITFYKNGTSANQFECDTLACGLCRFQQSPV